MSVSSNSEGGEDRFRDVGHIVIHNNFFDVNLLLCIVPMSINTHKGG